MKKDNSISKSDFQKQIEALNSETAKIENNFNEALNCLKKQEARNSNLQRILNLYLNSIVSTKNNIISTSIEIRFSIDECINTSKHSKYFKMLKEDKQANKDKVCSEIHKEMTKYVQSLIDELNTIINVTLYIKEAKPFSNCFIYSEYFDLSYFTVHIDIL